MQMSTANTHPIQCNAPRQTTSHSQGKRAANHVNSDTNIHTFPHRDTVSWAETHKHKKHTHLDTNAHTLFLNTLTRAPIPLMCL